MEPSLELGVQRSHEHVDPFSACLRRPWADKQMLGNFYCDAVIRCGGPLGLEFLRAKAMVHLRVLTLRPVSSLST